MTVTAWVKTTQSNAFYRPMAGNFHPPTVDGYSIGVRDGRVEAWYFRNGANYVWIGEGGLHGGFIADGAWHHLAFVVNAAGAALYVDAALARTRAWTGTAGATTSPEVFRIGRYSTEMDRYFAGQIDQVTLWTNALTSTDVVNRHRFEFSGKESELWASWNFNEGNGIQAWPVGTVNRDSHYALLFGDPAWITSTAPIHSAQGCPATRGYPGSSAQAILQPRRG
jgi:hypothetical protein